jgi:uroporphyrin-III C-methyltransferase
MESFRMKRSGNPKLYVVGAGPGDPDLITVKALKKLAEADVVLYDALVNKELLKYAPSGSKKIFVGKRSGTHRFTQDEINKMIVHYANERGHVVRLKGGDPHVFGRGFEEYSYAVHHRIPVEVVPGVSSATGLSASHHLPVTLRGTSESFWVVTGTTEHGAFSKDIRHAARSTATVIILMGMRKLPEIVKTYKHLKKGDYPVMIIQNGTMAGERQVIGKINSIERLTTEENISSPAIIVIGEIIEKTRDLILENRRLLQSYSGDDFKTISKKPKGTFSNINI